MDQYCLLHLLISGLRSHVLIVAILLDEGLVEKINNNEECFNDGNFETNEPFWCVANL